MPKKYSYQNLPVFYRVSILGEEIPSDSIEINTIDQSLDYPQLNVYRIAEANITLKGERYNPNRNPNFFTQATPAHTQSGYKAPVTIEAGFILPNGNEEKTTILQGIILNTNLNARTGHTIITVSDESQDMRTETVKEFGEEKRIKLQQGSSSGSVGIYPLPRAVLPSSEPEDTDMPNIGGYTAETTDNTSMTNKINLDTEGILDPENFTIEEGELRTEGGPLESGEPVLTFHAPYRNKSIKFLVEKILEKYDINTDMSGNLLDSQKDLIDIPDVTRQDHFATLGRIGYDSESRPVDGQDASEVDYWIWDGFITDFIHYEKNLYLLFSGGRASSTRPQIIRYHLESEESTVLYESDTYQEWWKIVGVDSNSNDLYDVFYVLGTQPQITRDNRIDFTGVTTLGYYNSSIPNPGTGLVYTRIWRIIPTNTAPQDQVVWVAGGSAPTLSPQLAVHYTIGASYRDHKSGDVPESRVGFAEHGGNLYYRWAHESGFGVARVAMSSTATSPTSPSAVLTATRDRDGYNSAGHDFTIDGNELFAAFTWVNDSDSRLKIVSKSIS